MPLFNPTAAAVATQNGTMFNAFATGVNISPGTNVAFFSPAIKDDAAISFSKARMIFSFSVPTTANTTVTWTGACSMTIGLFSRTGNSLTVMSSQSTTFSGSVVSSSAPTANGLPMYLDFTNISGTISAGQAVWLGFLRSYTGSTVNSTGGSTTNNQNGFSFGGANPVASAIAGLWGNTTDTSATLYPFYGMYSVTTNALPANPATSDVLIVRSLLAGNTAVWIPNLLLVGS